MSNVLKRFRSESSFQPLTDSRKLRSECLNWLFNENNCPRKKRNLFVDKMKIVCDELDITISKNKTHITKLSKGFTFLKTRFIILKNNKILKLVWKKTIIRERRKIKKLLEPFKKGLITLKEIENQVKSVVGSLKWKHSYTQCQSLLKLYKEIYL